MNATPPVENADTSTNVDPATVPIDGVGDYIPPLNFISKARERYRPPGRRERLAAWSVRAVILFTILGAIRTIAVCGLTPFGDMRSTLIWPIVVLFPFMFLPFATLLRTLPTPEMRAADLVYRMNLLRNIATTIPQPEKPLSYKDDQVPVDESRLRYLLTCVDKFVDEAQEVLTGRARVYYVFGAAAFFSSLAVLHIAGIVAAVAWYGTEEAVKKWAGTEVVTHFVVLRIFSALAVAAALYAIVKAFISFGKSFFHEATRLLDRRHALRFGRLYMYLRPDSFQFKEMEEAFQWHMESQTVFQSISPTAITDNALNRILQTLSQAAESVSKVRDATEPRKRTAGH